MLKAKHQDHAFDGEGARLVGGRWNNRGVPMVYCAAHVSLAALEGLTYLQAIGPLGAYTVVGVHFSEELVDEVRLTDLPEDWASSPAPSSLRALGDDWATSLRSLVLRVPSVVVPKEVNYLLNPVHPDFGMIDIGPAEQFVFDARLLDNESCGL